MSSKLIILLIIAYWRHHILPIVAYLYVSELLDQLLCQVELQSEEIYAWLCRELTAAAQPSEQHWDRTTSDTLLAQTYTKRWHGHPNHRPYKPYGTCRRPENLGIHQAACGSGLKKASNNSVCAPNIASQRLLSRTRRT